MDHYPGWILLARGSGTNIAGWWNLITTGRCPSLETYLMLFRVLQKLWVAPLASNFIGATPNLVSAFPWCGAFLHIRTTTRRIAAPRKQLSQWPRWKRTSICQVGRGWVGWVGRVRLTSILGTTNLKRECVFHNSLSHWAWILSTPNTFSW
jgi:hypothetical protein